MEIDTALSEIESKYYFTFKEKQLTAIKSIIDNKDTIDLCLQTFPKLLLLLAPKVTSNRNYSAILATIFASYD